MHIYDMHMCIWNNQRGVSFQRKTSLQMQILKGVRGEGRRGLSFRCAVNKLMMKLQRKGGVPPKEQCKYVANYAKEGGICGGRGDND